MYVAFSWVDKRRYFEKCPSVCFSYNGRGSVLFGDQCSSKNILCFSQSFLFGIKSLVTGEPLWDYPLLRFCLMTTRAVLLWII